MSRYSKSIYKLADNFAAKYSLNKKADKDIQEIIKRIEWAQAEYNFLFSKFISKPLADWIQSNFFPEFKIKSEELAGGIYYYNFALKELDPRRIHVFVEISPTDSGAVNAVLNITGLDYAGHARENDPKYIIREYRDRLTNLKPQITGKAKSLIENLYKEEISTHRDLSDINIIFEMTCTEMTHSVGARMPLVNYYAKE